MRVFIETTIVSYLTARPSRDVLQVALQPSLRQVVESQGYELPIICTPEELMEDNQ